MQGNFPSIRVVILGGKGGGTLAAQTVQRLARLNRSHELAGYLNDRLEVGSPVYGGSVLGKFEDWALLPQEVQFVAPLHKAAAMQESAGRIASLNIPSERWTHLVDPAAIIADDVPVGFGSVVSAGAQIGPASSVGSHCFLRAGAIVSHDVTVSDFVYIGQGSVALGDSCIEAGAHIAPGAVVRDGVRIGKFALVGIGSVVTGDVPPFAIVQGVPARIVSYVDNR